MNDISSAVIIRKVLGFQKEDDGSHAVIGFQPMAGNPFALAFTPDTLTGLFTACVNALGQWPMPKMANRAVCAIDPSWIEVGEGTTGNFAVTFRLQHGGSVSFYLNKESGERLLETLDATLHPSTPPPTGTAKQ